MDIELVTDPDACMMYIVSPLAGLGGGHTVAASRLRLVYLGLSAAAHTQVGLRS